jgi:predicted enzyme involved in methoxymalonyl-ACP biosynthesis
MPINLVVLDKGLASDGSVKSLGEFSKVYAHSFSGVQQRAFHPMSHLKKFPSICLVVLDEGLASNEWVS